MRAQRREGKLTDERVQKLDELGFNWISKQRDPALATTSTWEHYLQQMLKYKEEHGHCNVKRRDGRLGGWVHDQRQAYKKGKLTEEKILKLESIGFVWSMIDTPADQLQALRDDEMKILGHMLAVLAPLPDVLERDIFIIEEEDEEEEEPEIPDEHPEERFTPEEAEEQIRHIEALANLNAVTRLLSTQLNSVPYSDHHHGGIHGIGGISTINLIGHAPSLGSGSIIPVSDDPNEQVLASGNIQGNPHLTHAMSLQHIVNSELQHNK